MSDFEATKLRRALRAKGLCITCGTAPATPNKDGNMGLRCDPCSESYSGQKGRIKQRKTREANPTITHEVTTRDWRETPHFKFVTMTVKQHFKQAKKPLGIRELRELMGEEFPARKIFDHIEAIDGLYEVPMSLPTQWVLDLDRRLMPEMKYNRDQSTTPKMRVPRPDSVSIYGREALA